MSKQSFKDTLVHGKCKCGAPGQELQRCLNGHIQLGQVYQYEGSCNCCALCRSACASVYDKMAEVIRQEIDKEILDEIRKIYHEL